jgi:hypothetical protein
MASPFARSAMDKKRAGFTEVYEKEVFEWNAE